MFDEIVRVYLELWERIAATTRAMENRHTVIFDIRVVGCVNWTL